MTGWAAFWIFCTVSAGCATYFSVRVVKMAYEIQAIRAELAYDDRPIASDDELVTKH